MYVSTKFKTICHQDSKTPQNIYSQKREHQFLQQESKFCSVNFKSIMFQALVNDLLTINKAIKNSV